MGFYIAFCSLIVIMIIYPIIFLHFGEDYTVLFQLQSFEWTTSQHLLPSIFWLLIYILKSIGDWNLYIYLSVSYGNAKMLCSSSYL